MDLTERRDQIAARHGQIMQQIQSLKQTIEQMSTEAVKLEGQHALVSEMLADQETASAAPGPEAVDAPVSS